MHDSVNIVGERDREVVLIHRHAITHVDRIYTFGMLLLTLLHGWRWWQGESSGYGIAILAMITLVSFAITRFATRAPDSRKVEPWRFPIMFLVSPALVYYTDVATAFLATYLIMGVGTSALLGMMGKKTTWNWINLSLWSLNLVLAFSLLPAPNWHLCMVLVTMIFVLGATFFGVTRSLRTAVMRATQQTEELRRSQAELSRSTKFAALGEMAGGIAHEINTPLTVIHLKASQLMRLANQGSLDIEALRQVATTMESTARHIGTIVSSLRMFARQGKSSPFEHQDLGEIAREAVRLSRERSDAKDVLLETHLPDHPIPIECRAVPVTQVLVNLLNNALDAVGAQSKKWVGLEIRDAEASVEIRVSDGGSGIPADKRGQLFQPFYTTKEIGKGTGLGLSISKGIIETHRGRLFLDVAATHTTFIVVLPKRQPKDLEEIEP